MIFRILALFACIACLMGCRPETPTLIIGDNYAPPYDEVPLLLIENYVNRAYIDLQGREPLEDEMNIAVGLLRADSLSIEARQAFIETLQFEEDSRFGLPPYRDIFYQRIYERAKIDLLEGVPEADIQFDITQLNDKAAEDSIRADWGGVAFAHTEIEKLQAILDAPAALKAGEIDVSELYRRMIFNEVYDRINMGSYNFIHAVFQDFFFRTPTTEEFDQSFVIIEYNQSGYLFNQSVQTKTAYVSVLVKSREFYEGMIRGAYASFLAEAPNPAQLEQELELLYTTGDWPRILRNLMASDAYANF